MLPRGIMSVGAVVLAAGPGRRLGGGKLAAELHGEPILSHVCAPVVDALVAGVLGQGWGWCGSRRCSG